MYTSVSVPCFRHSCYKKGTLKHRVRNITRGTLIGGAIDSAETSAARRTGLLKHSKLDEGAGLWIIPCESVHTFFMKFAIDLVYLDREHRVRSVVRGWFPGGSRCASRRTRFWNFRPALSIVRELKRAIN